MQMAYFDKEWTFDFRHFFGHIAARLRLNSSKLLDIFSQSYPGSGGRPLPVVVSGKI